MRYYKYLIKYISSNYNILKISYLLLKYIEISWLYITKYLYNCKIILWYNKSWDKFKKLSKNKYLLIKTK